MSVFKAEYELSDQQKHFEQMLAKRYPKLTAMELLVCVLLREHNTAGQIAAILNISEAAIKYHKGNIKRKVSVPATQTLTTFLIAFG